MVPGFLEDASQFVELAKALRRRGVAATVAPISTYNWLPCLGGRSVRPILERIDYACAYAATADSLDLVAPAPAYTLLDLAEDFVTTPGGVFNVGGSADPDLFPAVTPRGGFDAYDGLPARRALTVVGHSAAGWIGRVFLSDRAYGGRAYSGASRRGVRRLVTLGSPHAASDGVA